jgi:hypothetical protein
MIDTQQTYEESAEEREEFARIERLCAERYAPPTPPHMDELGLLKARVAELEAQLLSALTGKPAPRTGTH